MFVLSFLFGTIKTTFFQKVVFGEKLVVVGIGDCPRSFMSDTMEEDSLRSGALFTHHFYNIL